MYDSTLLSIKKKHDFLDESTRVALLSIFPKNKGYAQLWLWSKELTLPRGPASAPGPGGGSLSSWNVLPDEGLFPDTLTMWFTVGTSSLALSRGCRQKGNHIYLTKLQQNSGH